MSDVDRFGWFPSQIAYIERKHLGPGRHPNGTPQSVHSGTLAPETGQVLDWLRMMAQYDLGARKVLAEGEWYAPAPLPDDLECGPAKACYFNAADAARGSDGRYRYVEGYAAVDLGGQAFVTRHAWVTDDTGAAYDVTWDDGIAYMGIEVDPDAHGTPGDFLSGRRLARETKAWDPHKHPRDPRTGRFVEKIGDVSSHELSQRVKRAAYASTGGIVQEHHFSVDPDASAFALGATDEARAAEVHVSDAARRTLTVARRGDATRDDVSFLGLYSRSPMLAMMELMDGDLEQVAPRADAIHPDEPKADFADGMETFQTVVPFDDPMFAYTYDPVSRADRAKATFTDTLPDDVDADEAWDLVRAWSNSSVNADGQRLQAAAMRMFGIDDARDPSVDAFGGATDLPDHDPVADAAAEALYAMSQSLFEPGETVTVWRGLKEVEVADGSPLQTKPLESWAFEPDSAEFFALSEERGLGVEFDPGGALLRVTVPAERVFSLGQLGLGGDMGEDEVVLVGGSVTPDKVYRRVDWEAGVEYKHAKHDQSSHGNWARVDVDHGLDVAHVSRTIAASDYAEVTVDPRTLRRSQRDIDDAKVERIRAALPMDAEDRHESINAPVIVAELDGEDVVVDGHHRVTAALRDGATAIDVVRIDIADWREDVGTLDDLKAEGWAETSFTHPTLGELVGVRRDFDDGRGGLIVTRNLHGAYLVWQDHGDGHGPVSRAQEESLDGVRRATDRFTSGPFGRELKHGGPGPHKRTGTPQAVHAGSVAPNMPRVEALNRVVQLAKRGSIDLTTPEARDGLGFDHLDAPWTEPTTSADNARIRAVGSAAFFDADELLTKNHDTVTLRPGVDRVVTEQPAIDSERAEEIAYGLVGDRNPIAVELEDGRLALLNGHHRWTAAALGEYELDVDVYRDIVDDAGAAPDLTKPRPGKRAKPEPGTASFNQAYGSLSNDGWLGGWEEHFRVADGKRSELARRIVAGYDTGSVTGMKRELETARDDGLVEMDRSSTSFAYAFTHRLDDLNGHAQPGGDGPEAPKPGPTPDPEPPRGAGTGRTWRESYGIPRTADIERGTPQHTDWIATLEGDLSLDEYRERHGQMPMRHISAAGYPEEVTPIEGGYVGLARVVNEDGTHHFMVEAFTVPRVGDNDVFSTDRIFDTRDEARAFVDLALDGPGPRKTKPGKHRLWTREDNRMIARVGNAWASVRTVKGQGSKDRHLVHVKRDDEPRVMRPEAIFYGDRKDAAFAYAEDQIGVLDQPLEAEVDYGEQIVTLGEATSIIDHAIDVGTYLPANTSKADREKLAKVVQTAKYPWQVVEGVHAVNPRVKKDRYNRGPATQRKNLGELLWRMRLEQDDRELVRDRPQLTRIAPYAAGLDRAPDRLRGPDPDEVLSLVVATRENDFDAWYESLPADSLLRNFTYAHGEPNNRGALQVMGQNMANMQSVEVDERLAAAAVAIETNSRFFDERGAGAAIRLMKATGNQLGFNGLSGAMRHVDPYGARDKYDVLVENWARRDELPDFPDDGDVAFNSLVNVLGDDAELASVYLGYKPITRLMNARRRWSRNGEPVKHEFDKATPSRALRLHVKPQLEKLTERYPTAGDTLRAISDDYRARNAYAAYRGYNRTLLLPHDRWKDDPHGEGLVRTERMIHSDSFSNWHPQGTGDVKSVITHEFSHHMWHLMGDDDQRNVTRMIDVLANADVSIDATEDTRVSMFNQEDGTWWNGYTTDDFGSRMVGGVPSGKRVERTELRFSHANGYPTVVVEYDDMPTPVKDAVAEFSDSAGTVSMDDNVRRAIVRAWIDHLRAESGANAPDDVPQIVRDLRAAIEAGTLTEFLEERWEHVSGVRRNLWVVNHVSEYAKTNDNEMTAEAMAEYLHADKPRTVASLIGAYMDSLFKGK